jgi:hypothetical protein
MSKATETKSTADACPKCGGESNGEYEYGARWELRGHVFKCRSYLDSAGEFSQSDACRIRELESERAALLAVVEAASKFDSFLRRVGKSNRRASRPPSLADAGANAMKPTAAKIEAAKKRLRKFIESTADPFEQRIAQGMEYALRWSTEETVGWLNAENEARELANILRNELAKGQTL